MSVVLAVLPGDLVAGYLGGRRLLINSALADRWRRWWAAACVGALTRHPVARYTYWQAGHDVAGGEDADLSAASILLAPCSPPWDVSLGDRERIAATLALVANVPYAAALWWLAIRQDLRPGPAVLRPGLQPWPYPAEDPAARIAEQYAAADRHARVAAQ